MSLHKVLPSATFLYMSICHITAVRTATVSLGTLLACFRAARVEFMVTLHAELMSTCMLLPCHTPCECNSLHPSPSLPPPLPPPPIPSGNATPPCTPFECDPLRLPRIPSFLGDATPSCAPHMKADPCTLPHPTPLHPFCWLVVSAVTTNQALRNATTYFVHCSTFRYSSMNQSHQVQYTCQKLMEAFALVFHAGLWPHHGLYQDGASTQGILGCPKLSPPNPAHLQCRHHCLLPSRASRQSPAPVPRNGGALLPSLSAQSCRRVGAERSTFWWTGLTDMSVVNAASSICSMVALSLPWQNIGYHVIVPQGLIWSP